MRRVGRGDGNTRCVFSVARVLREIAQKTVALSAIDQGERSMSQGDK